MGGEIPGLPWSPGETNDFSVETGVGNSFPMTLRFGNSYKLVRPALQVSPTDTRLSRQRRNFNPFFNRWL
jgi:hypothetical protein